MSKIGTADIKGIMLGNAEISKAYLGSDIVYQKSSLPYDAEIEYLESSGTQWIDTGIISTQPTDEFSTEVAMLEREPSVVFGWATSVFDHWYNLILYDSSSHQTKFKWGRFDANIYSAPPNIGDFHLYHTLVLSNLLHFFIDNIDVGILPPTTDNYDGSHIYLFGRNVNRSISKPPSSLKIKNFTYKRSGEYIVDFIPVRVGTIGYMYDKVSGQLFGNNGTGDFILGPDK